MVLPMDTAITYRGRQVDEQQATFIRALIAAHPEASRRELSRLLCAAWDWTQPNGQPRRKLDTTLAEQSFGFKSSTPFDIGLKRTIEWYERDMASQ